MIVNKTRNDRKLLHEALNEMGKKAYRYCTLLTVIIVLVLIFEFLTNDLYFFAIFGLLGAAGGIIMWEYAIKRIRKNEEASVNQIKKIYGEEYYDSTISFGDEKVTIETRTTTKEFNKSEIEGFKETENVIIIYYSGKSFLLVSKTGFIEGTYKELKDYLLACN